MGFHSVELFSFAIMGVTPRAWSDEIAFNPLIEKPDWGLTAPLCIFTEASNLFAQVTTSLDPSSVTMVDISDASNQALKPLILDGSAKTD